MLIKIVVYRLIMKLNNIAHLLAFGSLLAGVHAFPLTAYGAEGAGRGGGDAQTCGRFATVTETLNPIALIFAPTEVHLADVDSLSPLPSYYNFLTPDEARNGVMNYLRTHDPVLAEEVSLALAQLKGRFIFVKKLPELDTGFESMDRTYCSKKLVAMQNFHTGDVFVVQSLWDKFTVLDRVLLEFHEAFMKIESARSADLKAMETTARSHVRSMYFDWKDFGQALIAAHFAAGFDAMPVSAAQRISLYCGRRELYEQRGNTPLFEFLLPEAKLDDYYYTQLYFLFPAPGSTELPDSNVSYRGTEPYSDCLIGESYRLGFACSINAFVADSEWQTRPGLNGSRDSRAITFGEAAAAMARGCVGAKRNLPLNFPTPKQLRAARKRSGTEGP